MTSAFNIDQSYSLAVLTDQCYSHITDQSQIGTETGFRSEEKRHIPTGPLHDRILMQQKRSSAGLREGKGVSLPPAALGDASTQSVLLQFHAGSLASVHVSGALVSSLDLPDTLSSTVLIYLWTSPGDKVLMFWLVVSTVHLNTKRGSYSLW
ncbi:hypothetical protein JZ751_001978 [Albula glossodonta]|uniref:Uncharacterized protein n=1 Tax=Albula glossodonta TaxID=121402 RepID=A0A8T2P452_9TELE|nr:hypothetical protein JZ751_001978 [Albula glossodonta]